MIRTHHQQHIFRGEHAVAGQNIQNRVLAEKGLVKSTRSGMIRLPASAQKEVNSKLLLVFLLFHLVGIGVLDVVKPGGVGVILGICAVGHHKNLHVLKQT